MPDEPVPGPTWDWTGSVVDVEGTVPDPICERPEPMARVGDDVPDDTRATLISKTEKVPTMATTIHAVRRPVAMWSIAYTIAACGMLCRF